MAPEFTSICPVTGQPDFTTLVIDHVPGKQPASRRPAPEGVAISDLERRTKLAGSRGSRPVQE